MLIVIHYKPMQNNRKAKRKGIIYGIISWILFSRGHKIPFWNMAAENPM